MGSDLHRIAEEQPGLLGAITARAEAQVLRLSCLYALLDKTSTVNVQRLNAAYALWRYCEDSARHIFGEMLGDPLADELRRMLRLAGQEGSREQISIMPWVVTSRVPLLGRPLPDCNVMDSPASPRKNLWAPGGNLVRHDASRMRALAKKSEKSEKFPLLRP